MEESEMPPPQADRPDALDWAQENGWEHEETTSFDGDVFKRDDMELLCFWLSTPFSDAVWAPRLLQKAVSKPGQTGSGPEEDRWTARS
jgi:hypothetical protein